MSKSPKFRIEEKKREKRDVSSGPKKDSGRGAYIDWESVLLAWNQELARILGSPTINEMTEVRKQKTRVRLREHPKLWSEIREEAVKGLNQFAKEKRFVTFDWLMSPTNLTKFLEGTYRSKGYVESRPSGPSQEELLEGYFAEHPGVRRPDKDHQPAEEPRGGPDNTL